MAIKAFASVPAPVRTMNKSFKLYDWYAQHLPRLQGYIATTPEYKGFKRIPQSEVGRWVLWQAGQMSDDELTQFSPDGRTKSEDIYSLPTLVPALYPSHVDVLQRIRDLFSDRFGEDISEAAAFRVAFQAAVALAFPVASEPA